MMGWFDVQPSYDDEVLVVLGLYVSIVQERFMLCYQMFNVYKVSCLWNDFLLLECFFKPRFSAKLFMNYMFYKIITH